MESFTRLTVSHETQAAAINQIGDHVNALVRQAAKLQDAESLASPWQKQAIVGFRRSSMSRKGTPPL
jgi:hypothetical protein